MFNKQTATTLSNFKFNMKKKNYDDDDRDAENVDDDLTMINVIDGQKIIQNPSGVDQVNLFKKILIPSSNDILLSENIQDSDEDDDDDGDDDDDDDNQENRKCPTPPYFN